MKKAADYQYSMLSSISCSPGITSFNNEFKIYNKKILIFGGTGSLGNKFNEKYIENNIICNFSRDEHKHWKMRLKFKSHKNLKFIIGNVSDKYKVNETIKRIKPDIIIIASAMKHIEQCEIHTSESLKTNLIGTQNILDSIEDNLNLLTNLKVTIFVSTDKACSPINNYGMAKALSETLMIEKAHYIKNVKFVNVRYGNVLNSNGSIIPRLHNMGQNIDYSEFYLTHKDMTRFVMTLEQSVSLIEHAIINGDSGDTVISELLSMKVKDLIEIFSEKYNKPYKITGLRSGEKLLESLINETQSGRIEKHGKFTHIKSVFSYKKTIDASNLRDYNSTINPLTKQELKDYLIKLKLL
jgi:UDP-N-acetylglucosamine 4,6-dehydratase/5-epimerase